jgi:hypothetical protein
MVLRDLLLFFIAPFFFEKLFFILGIREKKIYIYNIVSIDMAKKISAWQKLIRTTAKLNPSMSIGEVSKAASLLYKKSSVIISNTKRKRRRRKGSRKTRSNYKI